MQEYYFGKARFPDLQAAKMGFSSVTEYLFWERAKNLILAREHAGDPHWAGFCQYHGVS